MHDPGAALGDHGVSLEHAVSGYSGLISFGHAAFFGLGGYTMTMLFVKFDITPWLGIPLGMLVGALAGIVIGITDLPAARALLRAGDVGLPARLLYVFEWLGYQEVTLPMKREAPALLHAVQRSAHLHRHSRSACWWPRMLVSLQWSARASACRCSRSSRMSLPAEAAGIDTLRWKMRAIVLSGPSPARPAGSTPSCCWW